MPNQGEKRAPMFCAGPDARPGAALGRGERRKGSGMPSKVIFERFLWFHHQVGRSRYPNAAALAERFEVSAKTAQRDIEFMRDRLLAPLVYVPARRGYRYEDSSYELPGLWLGEEELISLLLAFRLASAVPDSSLKSSLKSFLNQVLSLHSHGPGLSLDMLSRKVSVKNIEYSKTDDKTFQQVLGALVHASPVRIEYYSPHNDECTSRDILPLHLLSYMGTWHIVAHCALRGGLRDFTLSRIRSIAPSDVKIEAGIGIEEVKDYIRRNFGIMKGGESFEVCLRFSSAVAPWVAEQVWHPDQKAVHEPDGRMRLTFPAADLREIRREVLKHGSQVEVISPDALREEVRREIEKMSSLYR